MYILHAPGGYRSPWKKWSGRIVPAPWPSTIVKIDPDKKWKYWGKMKQLSYNYCFTSQFCSNLCGKLFLQFLQQIILSFFSIFNYPDCRLFLRWLVLLTAILTEPLRESPLLLTKGLRCERKGSIFRVFFRTFLKLFRKFELPDFLKIWKIPRSYHPKFSVLQNQRSRCLRHDSSKTWWTVTV